MEEEYISTIKEARKSVEAFAERDDWKDILSIDKFGRLHEELIEMSKHLRYRIEEERLNLVRENKEIFMDGGIYFFQHISLQIN